MPVDTTYTALREQLSAFLDRVADDQEVVIVKRRNSRDVALVPADELASLMETAHLLRSPKNAERLFSALNKAKRGKGRRLTVDQLRREMKLGGER